MFISSVDYSTYTFPYCVYAVIEPDRRTADLDEAYSRGFLPWTGNWRSGNNIFPHNVFYLARSVRLNCAKFADSSENRRLARKVDSLDVQLSVADLQENRSNIVDSLDVDFCTNYATLRFKDGGMSADRLHFVLARATHIFSLRVGANVTSNETALGIKSGDLLAYVVACVTEKSLHYWYEQSPSINQKSNQIKLLSKNIQLFSIIFNYF